MAPTASIAIHRSLASAFIATLLILTACDGEGDRAAPAGDAGSARPDAQAQTTGETESSATETSTSDEPKPGMDYHSFANPDVLRVTHASLELDVDFDAKRIDGTAVLDIERHGDGDRLILDTRDLTIDAAAVSNGGGDWREVEHRWGQQDKALGTALQIPFSADKGKVRIQYRTSPDASGVQWLTPEQTRGEHPFLFTQSQAIHARSWIPLQDSPQVRMTYDAVVRTPPALRAVMSASNDPDAERDGEYRLEMPQPVPSYLIALAVGDLEFRSVGDRSGVYAEPQVIDAAAKEFADTESMIETVEDLYGQYRWGRYDLLILPPSFPFGGMENPRLSFITPTVIAGDKSLVSLIAHELAHSWSGNLVSNATWRDLWLNEGFTVYVENRIMEALYGERRALMERVLGYQSLQKEMQELPPKDELLAIDLRGRHADDVFTGIPYTKGAMFLRFIERRVGRDTFDAFLRRYFDHFAFQSITTETFVDYLERTLVAEHPDKLTTSQVNEWIHEPGLPDDAPIPDTSVFDRVDAARGAWLEGERAAGELGTGDWSTQEWLYFLNHLPRDLSNERMRALDEALGLTQAGNSEIAHSWLKLAIETGYEVADERLEQYLMRIGRIKLVKPLYEALAKRGDEGRARARALFERARSGYHPLTVASIQEVLAKAERRESSDSGAESG